MCAYILKPDIPGGCLCGLDHRGVVERVSTAPARRLGGLSHPPPLGGLPKRMFDIIGASVALVLLAPLMLMVAGLVRLVLGGPAIFAQTRVGFGGKIFVCYKFRSMTWDADA